MVSASSARQQTAMLDMGRLPQLLDECQRSFGCHRKNAVIFRKLLNSGSGSTSAAVRAQSDAVEQMFFDLLKRVLAVKKREPAVERIVKFLITAVACMQQPSSSSNAAGSTEAETRFTGNLLRFLLRGVEGTDKAVRLRCCQLLALCMDCIDEMEDDLFEEIRAVMLERVRDKEAAVRVQAVLALSKFQVKNYDLCTFRCMYVHDEHYFGVTTIVFIQGAEDDEDEEQDDEELSVEQVLLAIMRTDPSG
jgi:condensin complex subunit 3